MPLLASGSFFLMRDAVEIYTHTDLTHRNFNPFFSSLIQFFILGPPAQHDDTYLLVMYFVQDTVDMFVALLVIQSIRLPVVFKFLRLRRQPMRLTDYSRFLGSQGLTRHMPDERQKSSKFEDSKR